MIQLQGRSVRDKAELRVVAALLEDVKTEVTSTLNVDTFTGDDSTTAFTLSQYPLKRR